MVHCFAHRHYKGKNPPVLSCKNCCHIFLTEVKRQRDSGRTIAPFTFPGTSAATTKSVAVGKKAPALKSKKAVVRPTNWST